MKVVPQATGLPHPYLLSAPYSNKTGCEEFQVPRSLHLGVICYYGGLCALELRANINPSSFKSMLVRCLDTARKVTTVKDAEGVGRGRTRWMT